MLFLTGNSSFFNYIGRFAFPIFAFQISEGYSHTRNLKKYMFRLFLFALVSQIPFMLFYSIVSDGFALNVIFTLLFGLVSIFVYDKYNKFIGIIATVLLGMIAQLSHCDYGFYGVAITFLFYVFRDNKLLLALGFAISTIVKFLFNIFQFSGYGTQILQNVFVYYIPYILFTLLSLIFILLYNKKKGYNTKYLLYLFYPLHLLLVYSINLFV